MSYKHKAGELRGGGGGGGRGMEVLPIKPPWLILFSPFSISKMADAAVAAPADKKAPPKFKQRTTRTFKSKAPKPGQKGWEGV